MAVQPPVVILVGPTHPGNVGAAARVAANFGCVDFRVVDPKCDIHGKEARDRAVHAVALLETARVTPDLPSALGGIGMSIGTTARSQPAEHKFLRKPLDVRDFCETVRGWDGQLAWVFGREDSGLTGPEVDVLDQLVTIPTENYSSLNLSHAVAVCCYEHHRLRAASITPERTLDPDAVQALHKAWDSLVEETEPREWRSRTARGVWRKVIGRSAPDTYEVHNIIGILANALKRFGRAEYETERSAQVLRERGLLVKGEPGGTAPDAARDEES